MLFRGIIRLVGGLHGGFNQLVSDGCKNKQFSVGSKDFFCDYEIMALKV